MNNDPQNNARLEPPVSKAYELYRTWGSSAEPEGTERRKAGASIPREFTLQDYAAGLQGEIRERFSLSGAAREYLMDAVRSGRVGDFTATDCQEALALTDALLVACLNAESSHGDSQKAIAAAQSAVPGFSVSLCARVIGWMGYLNR